MLLCAGYRQERRSGRWLRNAVDIKWVPIRAVKWKRSFAKWKLIRVRIHGRFDLQSRLFRERSTTLGARSSIIIRGQVNWNGNDINFPAPITRSVKSSLPYRLDLSSASKDLVDSGRSWTAVFSITIPSVPRSSSFTDRPWHYARGHGWDPRFSCFSARLSFRQARESRLSRLCEIFSLEFFSIDFHLSRSHYAKRTGLASNDLARIATSCLSDAISCDRVYALEIVDHTFVIIIIDVVRWKDRGTLVS